MADGSIVEAVRFARENRQLILEAAMRKWPSMTLAEANQLVERMLRGPERIGLASRFRSMLLGLVTMVAGSPEAKRP